MPSPKARGSDINNGWLHCLSLVTSTLLVVASLAAPSLHAGLTWEQREIKSAAKPNETEATTRFKFTNKGVKPLTIFSTNTSCGCTVAALQKKQFNPGESGEIAVTFKFGSRTGQLTETVMVRTDDENSDTELKFTVNVPRLFSLTPPFLFWRVDEPLKPKQAIFKIECDASAGMLTVVSSDLRMKVHAEPVTAGKEYKLTVTPDPAISGPMVKCSISIETTLSADQKISATLNAFAKH